MRRSQSGASAGLCQTSGVLPDSRRKLHRSTVDRRSPMETSNRSHSNDPGMIEPTPSGGKDHESASRVHEATGRGGVAHRGCRRPARGGHGRRRRQCPLESPLGAASGGWPDHLHPGLRIAHRVHEGRVGRGAPGRVRVALWGGRSPAVHAEVGRRAHRARTAVRVLSHDAVGTGTVLRFAPSARIRALEPGWFGGSHLDRAPPWGTSTHSPHGFPDAGCGRQYCTWSDRDPGPQRVSST